MHKDKSIAFSPGNVTMDVYTKKKGYRPGKYVICKEETNKGSPVLGTFCLGTVLWLCTKSHSYLSLTHGLEKNDCT